MARTFRDRVVRHVRKALTAGGIAASLGAGEPEDEVGYMVVDMMPAPACPPEDEPLEFKLKAEWESDKAVLRLWIYFQTPHFLVGEMHSPQVSGGAVVSSPSRTELLIRPTPGATQLAISADIVCDDHPVGRNGRLWATVDLRAARRLDDPSPAVQFSNPAATVRLTGEAMWVDEEHSQLIVQTFPDQTGGKTRDRELALRFESPSGVRNARLVAVDTRETNLLSVRLKPSPSARELSFDTIARGEHDSFEKVRVTVVLPAKKEEPPKVTVLPR